MMMSYLPVVLTGRTLGDRHRQMNALVEDAFNKHADIQELENASEKSALDRIFKIDLASKYQHVDYILKTLKDTDMLYVTRALKCTWLLEPKHSGIINPTFLVEVLFPEMITTSVNKMKHWISLHLRDPERCQQFYEYFNAKNNDFAMTFLWHCSSEFILSEAKHLLAKMTPEQFKLMSESCPMVAKLFIDSLKHNRELIAKYLHNEMEYYNYLKRLLKIDTDLFLDYIEKYFNIHYFRRLGSDATKFIMKNRKNRFMDKPELYTAYVLDIKTLAAYLSSEEIKDIITKLARVEYEYISWFSYKNVEPLLKQLSQNDRAQFKKHIFDKNFGQKVKQYPYVMPSPPESKESSDMLIVLDTQSNPRDYETPDFKNCKGFRRMIKKRKYGKWTEIAGQSPLDKLFNRFRFHNFERTFHILRKEMLATTATEHRMHMLLVLVSKSGGRADTLENLLRWLATRHSNEVITLRAAVVRSLVKRAAVWRISENSWQMLFKFGRGLGLDGETPETDCIEGLHAVILRNLLSSSEITLPIYEAYLRTFSSLREYPLTTEEKRVVKERLPAKLLATAEGKINDDKTCDASEIICNVLDVLQAYSVPAHSYFDVISAVKRLAQKDPGVAEKSLLRLYKNRIARKHLTSECFDLMQTEASYLNALRHEPELITNKNIHQILEKELKLDVFLRKLAIYFNEEGGLATGFMEVVREEIKENPRTNLTRPLAILAGASLVDQLKYYDEAPRNSFEKRMACCLKANAHMARPKLDIERFGWRNAGVTAVANQVMICSSKDIPATLEKLLEWRSAAKVALNLAIRGGLEVTAFPAIAKSNPPIALKQGLTYICSKENHADPCVWDSVKPLITTVDLSSRKKIQQILAEVDSVPHYLRAAYAVLVFEAFKRLSLDKAMPILCHIENNLPDVSDEFIAKVIEEPIAKNFILDELQSVMITEESYVHRMSLFVRIVAKHLLLCRSEDEQKKKMENVGKPFLETLKAMKEDATKIKVAIKYLDEFLTGLRYTRVYMDNSYVSCLPVLQDVADWMDKNFPLQQWFAKHMKITLHILIFKTIRAIKDKDPDVFLEPPKVTSVGLQKIGLVFGLNIVQALNETKQMFRCIEYLYWQELRSYINDLLESNRQTFGISVCKAIVQWGKDSSARYLANELYEEYNIDSESSNESDYIDQLNEDPEILFYINRNSF